MSLEKRYNNVKDKIEIAENKTISKDKVMLIGVTKTIEVEQIQKVVNLGLKDLGENKVQEFLTKYDKIKGNVNWHFIGRLQRNKVKYIIDKVNMIHSVDSVKLAVEIDKRAKQHKLVMDVLIQVNIENEPTKSGIKYNEINYILDELLNLKNINVVGLMIIPKKTENTTYLREIFYKISNKSIDINNDKGDNVIRYLSMGMSYDFETAIECGSNIVRVGRKIFGERESREILC